MEYHLRKAGKDDWAFIWSLRVATMKDLINGAYGWDESLQQKYAEESLNGEIVMIGDTPVGVITLADLGDQLHLTWMAILPEKQGQGLGTALIEYCQQQAREKNRVLTLQVLKSNRALSLYKKCGFEIYGQNGPDKLLMRWQPGIT